MSAETTVSAEGSPKSAFALRWFGLLVFAAVTGVLLGITAAYVMALGSFPGPLSLITGLIELVKLNAFWVCAYAVGRLTGGFAISMNLDSAAAKKRSAMLGIGLMAYGYLAFYGVANGVLGSPAFAPDSIGSYLGMLASESGLSTRLAFMVPAFAFASFIAVRTAARVRQRLYLPSPELPLLRRELTELANRKRTYVIRVIGAIVILYLVFDYYQLVMEIRLANRGTFGPAGPAQFLGIGEEIFARVVPILFIIISLLLPALCCASVTQEKESNTIGTLLLTRLSPGTIVLEKFGSRLVPMLTLLLLTFPVLAHVYALGGVDTKLLLGTIWLLLCQCFMVAAMAIFCSSWFATTVSAFICSYALIGLLAAMIFSLEWDSFVPFAIWRREVFGVDPWAGVAAATAGPFVGSLPSLVVTGMFLAAARIVLVRRAFPMHSSLILKAFRALDGFFKRLNDRTTGGVELVADSDEPPDDDPIAWRERTKKSLGKARYLVRVLLALEFPVLFVCLLTAISSSRSAFHGLYALQGIVWTLCTLIVAVKAATLMASERSRQTLEALLATPLTAREIVDQKVVGTRRLVIVMCVPILTINLTHFMIQVETSSLAAFVFSLTRPAIYLLTCIVSTVIFLSLVTWVSLWLGIRIHSQTKAVITAAVCLLMWVLAPLFVASWLPYDSVLRDMVMVVSPYGTIRATELFLIENLLGYRSSYRTIDAPGMPQIVLTVGAMLGQFALLVVIRALIRRRAPRLLQRRDQVFEQPPQSRAAFGTLEGTSA